VYLAVIAVKYPYQHWFAGLDQGWYLSAARAWAAGSLDPSQHYYPPGYPLLGALFVRLLPMQPFLVPDFVCLLATFWIFIRICRHLTQDPDRGQIFGTVAFLIATLSSPQAVTAWIWPWSTTGSAPLILGALLGILRFDRDPRPKVLFWTMLSGGAVVLFRPTDAAIVLAFTGMFALWTRIERRVSRRDVLIGAAAAVAGAAIPVAIYAAIHLAIFGLARGHYLTATSRMGFNLNLLPWRWVALVVDPRPLFPEGVGLARIFPWIIPGIAGMALFLLPRKDNRIAPHVLVIGTMAAYWVLYLAFVDLQPYGLWRYSNYHYFKLSQPFLAFYALLLIQSLVKSDSRRRAAAALIVTIVALFLWRPELRQRDPAVRSAAGNGPIILSEGLSHTRDVAIVPAQGDWTELYMGHHHLTIGGQSFLNSVDFKVFPIPGGVMVLPIHNLPDGKAELNFTGEISTDPDRPVLEDQFHIAFGIPCLFGNLAGDCGEQPKAP
jgi:hypothetical protein